jgi:predicted homoserine dehydrogenase-like protein
LNGASIGKNQLMSISLPAELREHVERHGPITIGLAGAGQMGTDIVVQVALMFGLRIGGVFERRPNVARAAALMAGHAEDAIVEARNASSVTRAIELGKIAVTEDFESLATADGIDVVIDATGNPNTGALFALTAMKHGKHVVMLNVEADITIGRYLKAEARRAGVVYTGAAGDEPAATVELISFARCLGLDVVAAGKGKNNPLRFDATPDAYGEEARARNMNARMLVEFVDGSKTMIEMTAIANATGLVPDKPGMHGPNASIGDLANVLCPVEHGGVLSKPGVVDYSIGKGVAPGVFCIVQTQHPRVLERMVDLKVGKGPFFTLYRPFHLTSLETPLSAARAFLHRRPDIEPLDEPVAEAVAVAKRDLKPGDVLGRIGEYDYRGWAMTWKEARRTGAMPIGLVEAARVMKPVKTGEFLTSANCIPEKSFTITQIRSKLDQMDARFLPRSDKLAETKVGLSLI